MHEGEDKRMHGGGEGGQYGTLLNCANNAEPPSRKLKELPKFHY